MVLMYQQKIPIQGFRKPQLLTKSHFQQYKKVLEKVDNALKWGNFLCAILAQRT